MREGCLEEKIKDYIQSKKSQVFMRSDFEEICKDYDQIGRALSKLVKKGVLIKIGYGVYTKAKKSLVSGKSIPRQDLRTLGMSLLKKLKIITKTSQSEENYNTNLSTQIPTGRVIAVQGRISRKIGYNGNYIIFEKIRRQYT